MHTALFEKEDSMKYEVKLFDDSLKTLFSTEDKVSYDDNKKDYQFTISDFDINNFDDVFLVVNEGFSTLVTFSRCILTYFIKGSSLLLIN